jgi:hypothetical protein
VPIAAPRGAGVKRGARASRRTATPGPERCARRRDGVAAAPTVAPSSSARQHGGKTGLSCQSCPTGTAPAQPRNSGPRASATGRADAAARRSATR